MSTSEHEQGIPLPLQVLSGISPLLFALYSYLAYGGYARGTNGGQNCSPDVIEFHCGLNEAVLLFWSIARSIITKQ